MISKKQREEWAGNPVTIKFKDLVNKEVREIALTPPANCLHYGKPQETQEALVRQDTMAFVFAVIDDALKGDWSYFGEIDEE